MLVVAVVVVLVFMLVMLAVLVVVAVFVSSGPVIPEHSHLLVLVHPN
jgi:hypothetical protein